MHPPVPSRREWLTTAVAATAGLAIPSVAVADTPTIPHFRAIADPPMPMLAGHFGDDRFRSEFILSDLQFTPNGRSLFGFNESGLIRWDTATGRRTAVARPPDQWTFCSFSPVLPNGDVIVVLQVLTDSLNHRFPVFRLNGTTLKPVSQLQIYCHPSSQFAFHPGGGSLFVKMPYSVALFDLSDGHEIWKRNSQYLLENSPPVFSPLGDTVALLRNDRDVLIVETKTGDFSKFRYINSKIQGLERLHWSPDARYLLSREDQSAQILIRDLQDNRELDPIRLKNPNAMIVPFQTGSSFAIVESSVFTTCPYPGMAAEPCAVQCELSINCLARHPFGETVAVSEGRAVQILNAMTGKPRPQSAEFPHGFAMLGWRDRSHLSAYSPRARVEWCLKEPRNHHSSQIAESADAISLSPDWKQAIILNRKFIHRIHAGTGKTIARYPFPHPDVEAIAWSQDGRYLLCGGDPTAIWRIDIANGQQIKIPLPNKLEEGRPLFDAGGPIPNPFIMKKDVADQGSELTAIDIESGTVRWHRVLNNRLASLIQSKDGKRFATIEFCEADDVRFCNFGDIGNLATLTNGDAGNGRTLHSVDLTDTNLEFTPEFTPDSRLLLIGRIPDAVSVLELATLEERFRIGGIPSQNVWFIASQTQKSFSPNSRLLAISTQGRYPVDLYNLRGEANPSDPIPDNYTANRAWHDLNERNGNAGFRAVRWLAANPAKSIPLLSSRIQPVPPIDESTASQWIGQLDDADFEIRIRAFHNLANAGMQLTKKMSVAVEQTHSAEVRSRLRQLLDGYERASPKNVPLVRACEALEWMESDDAKRLLREWAGGAAGAFLTGEASATLARLDALRKADVQPD